MTHTDQRVQSPGQAIGRVELSVDVGQQQLPVLGRGQVEHLQGAGVHGGDVCATQVSL